MTKATLFALLILSINAAAQTKGGAIFLKGGYAYTPGAEKAFAGVYTNGIGGFANNFSLMGLEGVYRLNRWSLAAEASMGTQKARTEDIYSIKPFTGAGHGSVGYILHERKDYWLYPSIGFGASAHNLYLRERLYGKNSKIDNIRSYAPSIDIAFNCNLVTTKETKGQKTAGGLILAVRAGYRYSMAHASWKSENGEILVNESSYRNNAYYIFLLAGFGMFKNK
jgi:hypothetical protein